MRSTPSEEKRFDPSGAERLLSLERHARYLPEELLRSLGVAEGHRVADLGCGPGFWALPLARIVGASGRVAAIDASPRMLELLARQGPPPWLDMIEAELPDTGLPESWGDWVWLAFVLHEVDPHSGWRARRSGSSGRAVARRFWTGGRTQKGSRDRRGTTGSRPMTPSASFGRRASPTSRSRSATATPIW